MATWIYDFSNFWQWLSLKEYALIYFAVHASVLTESFKFGCASAQECTWFPFWGPEAVQGLTHSPRLIAALSGPE